ncbi:MAG: exodeoxyribonuclease VII small subunit [Clostridia bacterium]|nr:exodeoxyribonuclease VII small subunit [Clostridia bacterium]
MNQEKDTQKVETVDFESALKRLEEIVDALENGDSPLERSLSLFEEGVGLIRSCNTRLDEAEQKVKILLGNGDGTYNEQVFTKIE